MDPSASISRRVWRSSCPQRGRLRLPAWPEKRTTGTLRERDVAALIGRGLTNADIAERLVISERTVESHTGRIYDKLGCTTRSQITAWAIARGLSASATDV